MPPGPPPPTPLYVEVKTVLSQLSDKIFVQKLPKNKLLSVLATLDCSYCIYLKLCYFLPQVSRNVLPALREEVSVMFYIGGKFQAALAPDCWKLLVCSLAPE